MPVVNGFEAEFGDQLQVLRLDFNDRRNEDAMRALGIRGHPTIVLVDKKGAIFATRLGAHTAEQLRPHVEALLAR